MIKLNTNYLIRRGVMMYVKTDRLICWVIGALLLPFTAINIAFFLMDLQFDAAINILAPLGNCPPCRCGTHRSPLL